MRILRNVRSFGALLFAVILILVPARGSRGDAEARPAAAHRFILFLYEGSRFDRAGSHVAEYTDWARALRQSGTTVSGEELAGNSRAVLSGGSVRMDEEGGRGEDRLGGYFVVEAKDLQAAVRIARSCPHLKHGGRIVVRGIER